MQNIGSIIPRHARYRGNHTAIVFEGHRLTYRQFNARVNKLSHALLDMGLTKGDKIAIILPNSLEILDVLWATAKMGMVAVPLSPLLRGQGLQRLLDDSDSVMVITIHDMVQHLNPLRNSLPDIKEFILIDAQDVDGYTYYGDFVASKPETEPPLFDIDRDDLYNIIYSSGTTGLPKGIMHTHHVRANYCTEFSSAFRISPESIILHTGSLVFNGAYLTFMPAFYLGATYVLHPAFDVERLIETVEKEKITHIMMVPSQIVAMLHSPNFDPKRMQSLEMIMTVGAPLHLEHKQELTTKLPGVFYELYGLTEGCGTILDRTMYKDKPGSVGAPPPLWELRIVSAEGQDMPAGEVGEIVGRTPIIMAGYYKQPELTANAIRDGWLYTGDMGYLDEDGYLYLVDRKKDLIISGAVNIYPRDIEEIIVQHPDVIEAAVFGIPDEKWGETPAAAIILKNGAKSSADDIKEWTNERVNARYQKLSLVTIREEFPRSVSGKTLKRVMREAFWQDRDTRI